MKKTKRNQIKSVLYIIFIPLLIGIEAMALEVKYEIVESGIVYNGPLGGQLPCVVKTQRDEIIVNFNTGKDFALGSIPYMIRSMGFGHRWTSPSIIYNSTYPIHTNIGMTTLQDGRIILPISIGKLNDGFMGFPKPNHPDIKFTTAAVLISESNGRRWSGPYFAGGGLPSSAAFGRVVEMLDGTLFLPIWAFRQWGTDGAVHASQRHCGYVVSEDGGKTWGQFKKISDGGETSILLLADRKTLMSISKTEGDLYRLSYDNGVTWRPYVTNTHIWKNVNLHLSPHGFPLIINSGPGGIWPGTIVRGDIDGLGWRHVLEIPSIYPYENGWTYGLSAVNLDRNHFMVVFTSVDLLKDEIADSPWTTSKSYVGYSVVRETVESGLIPKSVEPLKREQKVMNHGTSIFIGGF